MRHINKAKEAAFLTLPESMRNKIWMNFHTTGHCWRWATPTRNKYPALKVGGLKLQANRAAWLAKFGPIPDGMLVCHRCDNTKCINPAHLFLGTQSDNMTDCGRKNRSGMKRHPHLSCLIKWNEKHGKLKPLDVLRIREMHANGQRYAAIARQFNACPGTIRKVILGQTWAHVQSITDLI